MKAKTLHIPSLVEQLNAFMITPFTLDNTSLNRYRRIRQHIDAHPGITRSKLINVASVTSAMICDFHKKLEEEGYRIVRGTSFTDPIRYYPPGYIRNSILSKYIAENDDDDSTLP